MRIKKGFELRDVCGEHIIVAYGIENIDFNKVISLNESATYLWKNVVDKDFDVETMPCFNRNTKSMLKRQNVMLRHYSTNGRK